MDWEQFVIHFSKKDNFPVIVPLLRQSKVIELSDTDCKVACVNLGAKQFLDGRRNIIESILQDFTGKPLTLTFVVQQKSPAKKSKKKKEVEEASISLMDFQGESENKIRLSGLQFRYTFDSFAVSPTNHMAYAAAQTVAQHPSVMYNPLFIYGSVGVGKTHLSQAIAHDIVDKNPRKRVLYCTSEQFTNDLVDAIRKKNTPAIRDKYRLLDVLIIDDTQFIAGKNYVQEEFYHTFNTLVQAGSQIILVSDRPPSEIKALEDRLRSRFSGGLIIDMQKPDFELRAAIVLIKAKERNIDIDMQAAQSIAERITDSRELEGALLKLLSLSLTQGDSNKITADSATTELKRASDEKSLRVKPHDIIQAVASYYDLKPSDIKGPSRKQNIAFARQVIMYFLRHKLKINLDEIAFITKRKDHTTVIHGAGKIEGLILRDDRIRSELETLYSRILEY